ncbi:unnamed protein product [Linum trigynum]|uniref:Uncharacterized protein n=1 Tax=Linum trigynum TaxID=586398 RepID=A0AAV2F8X2_9ROSI
MHGVVKFAVKKGQLFKLQSSILPYTRYFAESLVKEAEADNNIVAIHAEWVMGYLLKVSIHYVPSTHLSSKEDMIRLYMMWIFRSYRSGSLLICFRFPRGNRIAAVIPFNN